MRTAQTISSGRPSPSFEPSEKEDGQHLSFEIPPTAITLAGFREWSYAPDFPERGKITFLDGEIIVDMSPERLDQHNYVKGEISRVLATLVREQKLGRFYADGARVANTAAQVSNEPDAMFASLETLRAKRVRTIPTKDKKGMIEIEGTPDWVMEIISPSSVKKDKVKLRASYYAAGIPEYWLVDALGEKIDFQILRRGPTEYASKSTKSGWQKSEVFGKRFRLVRVKDEFDEWDYTLEIK